MVDENVNITFFWSDLLNSSESSTEVSKVTTLIASSSPSEASSYYTRDVFLMILYSVTGVLALYGNYLVCRIIFDTNSKLKNSTNILVGNLAISDVLGGFTIFAQWFFCSARAIESWRMEFPCAVVKSLQVLSFYMSSIIMMLIAFERFVAIMFPLTRPFNSKLWVTITWIATTLFVASSLGSAKVFEYFTEDKVISCRIVLVYHFTLPFINKTFHSDQMRTLRVWGIWLGQFFLPLLVTGILYAFIAIKIWTKQKAGISTAASKDARDAKKKRIVLMLIVVVIVFALCWLPLHGLNFGDYVIKKLEKGKGKKGKLCNDSTTYFLLYWLGISSCCYNPFIYWWMNPEFRRGFKVLLPSFITKFMSREYSTSAAESEQQSREGTELTKMSA